MNTEQAIEMVGIFNNMLSDSLKPYHEAINTLIVHLSFNGTVDAKLLAEHFRPPSTQPGASAAQLHYEQTLLKFVAIAEYCATLQQSPPDQKRPLPEWFQGVIDGGLSNTQE